MGYSDELVKELCNKYLKLGFTHFKVKVGTSIEDDIRRCNSVRKSIGDNNYLVSTCHLNLNPLLATEIPYADY